MFSFNFSNTIKNIKVPNDLFGVSISELPAIITALQSVKLFNHDSPSGNQCKLFFSFELLIVSLCKSMFCAFLKDFLPV